jgi:ornithine cyclodeaminase/alanine dehydrogenase-like protein (mu-crystallin family)
MPRYVSEAEVAAALTPADALEAVEQSFVRLARGEIDGPPRQRFALPDGQFAVMACVDRGLGYAGLKTYAWTPGEVPFLVVLFTVGGQLAAIVEAARLSELRTAAASAVAARRLARTSPASLGVFGAGRQAASHVAALRDALPSLERTVVYAPGRARLEAFCAAHGAEPAESPADAGGCDVVVTATSSAVSVLHGEWLREGAFVCAVGANDAAFRELDDVVLERAALICVDSLDQAREEAGDLIQPAARGVLDWGDVHELQEVVAGSLTGRSADSEITLFKSGGMAAWDIAIAVRVLELL